MRGSLFRSQRCMEPRGRNGDSASFFAFSYFSRPVCGPTTFERREENLFREVAAENGRRDTRGEQNSERGQPFNLSSTHLTPGCHFSMGKRGEARARLD